MLSPKQIRGTHWNETAYPKGALIRTRTLIKKKTNSRGRLLSTVLNILLFKRVSSRFLRTVVSYRAVSYPKFNPFIPSLIRIVPEMLLVRVHEQISVVRLFPRTTGKWSQVNKIQAKFWCVYLWPPREKQLDYCLALSEWYFLNRTSLLFAVVTLLSTTTSVIFLPPLFIKDKNSLILTKETNNTRQSRKLQWTPLKQNLLTQGILLFKIADRPFFKNT